MLCDNKILKKRGKIIWVSSRHSSQRLKNNFFSINIKFSKRLNSHATGKS